MTDGLQLIDRTLKLNKIRENILKFIATSGIEVPATQTLEISHHYGLEKYSEYGLAMITLVNFEYCKKYLILLPGQKNPAHKHEIKDESFFVLHGQLTVRINDEAESVLEKGQILRIEPGQIHEFWSTDGCIVEELSTKHNSNDSFYVDKKINDSANRKSFIDYWCIA